MCSSATSSPVTLRGAGNHKASPSSSASPLAGSRSATRAAMRGLGRPRPDSAMSAAPALGPEMRTMAMPAAPRPDERAKMVPAFMENSADCAGIEPSQFRGARQLGPGLRRGDGTGLKEMPNIESPSPRPASRGPGFTRRSRTSSCTASKAPNRIHEPAPAAVANSARRLSRSRGNTSCGCNSSRSTRLPCTRCVATISSRSASLR